MADTYSRSALAARLTSEEGDKLHAYHDSRGIWTIGIGRNLESVGTVPLSRSVADVEAHGITQAEALTMFNYDMDRVDHDLDTHLPWWRKLDPIRQEVLADMCFNMGITRLLGFARTLRLIERGDYADAADGMMASLWAKQVHGRAAKLAQMMRTGKP